MTRVRIGTVGDIDAVASIWERAHQTPNGLMSESTRKDLAQAFLTSRVTLPDAEFLVAEFDAEIIGMLFAIQAREHDGTGDLIPRLAHVSYVAVDPAHWGRGIATRLLDQLVRQAQARGYDRLQLWVEARNERASKLYEHYGFAFTGQKKLDGHGHPAMQYIMKLGPP